MARQTVYQLLDDNRSQLGRLLEERTAQKLADALAIPVTMVWVKVLESLGVSTVQFQPAPDGEPNTGGGVNREEIISFLASEGAQGSVPDHVLLGLLRQRFDQEHSQVSGEVLEELGDLRAMKARLEALLNQAHDGLTIGPADLEQAYHGIDQDDLPTERLER